MRNRIVRAFEWALLLLLPSSCRHAATPAANTAPTIPAAVAPVPISPWEKGWRGPSSAQARAIFHAEEVQGLTLQQRDRWYTAAFAEIGVEYPYRYPNDHFTQHPRRMGVSA